MKTGMLWFDNSKTPLDIKIRKATEYYNKKYGRLPNLVLIHPSMLEGQKINDPEVIEVRAFRPVLPGHIWIGISDES